MDNCFKCNNQCLPIDSITCGICSNKVHVNCSNIMDNNAINLLKNNKNVVYKCDKCVALFSRAKIYKALKSVDTLQTFFKVLTASERQSELTVDSNNAIRTRSQTKVGAPKSTQKQSSPLLLPADQLVHSAESTERNTLSTLPVGANDIINCVTASGEPAQSVESNILPTLLEGVNNNNNSSDCVAINNCAANSNSVISPSFAAAAASAADRFPPNDVGIQGQREAAFKTTVDKPYNVVSGTNENADLDVFVRYRWLHLSSFRSSVKEENIIQYISQHTNIVPSRIACFKLTKRDADVNSLVRVSFKLRVLSTDYSKVFDASLWPTNVSVRPFRFFPKRDQNMQET